MCLISSYFIHISQTFDVLIYRITAYPKDEKNVASSKVMLLKNMLKVFWKGQNLLYDISQKVDDITRNATIT